MDSSGLPPSCSQMEMENREMGGAPRNLAPSKNKNNDNDDNNDDNNNDHGSGSAWRSSARAAPT